MNGVYVGQKKRNSAPNLELMNDVNTRVGFDLSVLSGGDPIFTSIDGVYGFVVYDSLLDQAAVTVRSDAAANAFSDQDSDGVWDRFDLDANGDGKKIAFMMMLY